MQVVKMLLANDRVEPFGASKLARAFAGLQTLNFTSRFTNIRVPGHVFG